MRDHAYALFQLRRDNSNDTDEFWISFSTEQTTSN